LENENNVLAPPMDLDLSPDELELLERLDQATVEVAAPIPLDADARVHVDVNAPVRLDLDQEMADIEVELEREPCRPPQQAEKPQTHGYATIEVHPNAARVYRWYIEDEGPRDRIWQDDMKEKEIFELCEWLIHAPISNTKRAEFLNFEIVSIPDTNMPQYSLLNVFVRVEPTWDSRNRQICSRTLT
jgi:hypothetical protein